MIKDHLPFIILLLFTFFLIILFFLKGPSHDELEDQWYQYSTNKLRYKITELIKDSGSRYYPKLIDPNEGGTTLLYMYDGKGKSYHGNIDRDGKWWIQHSPSANGKLINQIVFRQSGGYQLDDGVNFSSIADFFIENLDRTFKEIDYINYLKYSDSLRMEFMILNKLAWSNDKGFYFAFLQYLNNNTHNNWNWNYSHGSLMVTGSYTNNKKDGEWNWYFPNGNKALVENYNNGLLVGNSVFHNIKGDIISKLVYDKGKIISDQSTSNKN